MSTEQVGLLIGGSQLIIALLYWLGVKPAKLWNKKNKVGGRNIVMTSRNKWIGLLLGGGLAFCALGFYRTLPRAVNPSNVESTTKRLLTSFGYGVTPQTPDQDSYFLLKVALETGRPVFISRSHRFGHYVEVQGAVNISAEHLALIGQMSREQRSRLAQDLAITMAQSKIGFAESNPLQRIVLSKRIPITDTFENSLLDAVDEIDSAEFLVIAFIRRAVGVQE